MPRAVWEFRIGGYQVVKKWLSLPRGGRARPAPHARQGREVTGMIRRLAAIVIMGPALDANYRAVVADAIGWPSFKRA